jgi:hypothetical protein
MSALPTSPSNVHHTVGMGMGMGMGMVMTDGKGYAGFGMHIDSTYHQASPYPSSSVHWSGEISPGTGGYLSPVDDASLSLAGEEVKCTMVEHKPVVAKKRIVALSRQAQGDAQHLQLQAQYQRSLVQDRAKEQAAHLMPVSTPSSKTTVTNVPTAKISFPEDVNELTTRRDRNREHARKSRLRKKLLVVSQQQRMAELEHTNRALVDALKRYAPETHVDSLLDGAVKGGMEAALKPMAAPHLPRSHRESRRRGAPSAPTALQGSDYCSAPGVPPRCSAVKGTVQAAHLNAELLVLEKIKNSLLKREKALAAEEMELEQRAIHLSAAEKDQIALHAQLSFLQQGGPGRESSALNIMVGPAAPAPAPLSGSMYGAAGPNQSSQQANEMEMGIGGAIPECSMRRIPSVQWDVDDTQPLESIEELMQMLDENPQLMTRSTSMIALGSQ